VLLVIRDSTEYERQATDAQMNFSNTEKNWPHSRIENYLEQLKKHTYCTVWYGFKKMKN